MIIISYVAIFSNKWSDSIVNGDTQISLETFTSELNNLINKLCMSHIKMRLISFSYIRLN